MKRKCYTCGKMATDPYTYSIVPTYNVYNTIPPYSKRAEKIKRSELKGIVTYNYCNVECYEFMACVDELNWLMKAIGLVSHDNKKIDMVEWCNTNKEKLKNYKLYGTEGTAKRINQVTGLEVEDIGHGPDGGDIHIAYSILESKLNILIFFIDTKKAHGHEHDIQTLIRTCATMDIPFALNKATATYLIDES